MGHVVILCIEDYILETIYLLYRVSGIFPENTLKLYFIVYRKLFTKFLMRVHSHFLVENIYLMAGKRLSDIVHICIRSILWVNPLFDKV